MDKFKLYLNEEDSDAIADPLEEEKDPDEDFEDDEDTEADESESEKDNEEVLQ